MSRPVRIEFPGAYYYITSKRIADGLAFRDREDKAAFLKVLSGVVTRFNWLLHSYVLMENHYHLVVACPQANLSKGMCRLNGVYTQHFNRCHGQKGPLFQGRFHSVLFEAESYLLPLCRHVVLNPVRTKAASYAEEYPWSSHRAMGGQIKVPDFLCDQVLLSFGQTPTKNQHQYCEYVKAGVGATSPLLKRASQVLLGSADFLAAMQPILDGEQLVKRGPKRAGSAKLANKRKQSLSAIFKNIEHKSKIERNELICRAHIDYGHTLMAIGQFLGLHYTTVSKIVNQ